LIEIDECTSITLTAEDGSELTFTMLRDGHGEYVVSLYADDGMNVTQIHIPRKVFDILISEIRTLQ
jgi:hypothetical protein